MAVALTALSSRITIALKSEWGRACTGPREPEISALISTRLAAATTWTVSSALRSRSEQLNRCRAFSPSSGGVTRSNSIAMPTSGRAPCIACSTSCRVPSVVSGARCSSSSDSMTVSRGCRRSFARAYASRSRMPRIRSNSRWCALSARKAMITITRANPVSMNADAPC